MLLDWTKNLNTPEEKKQFEAQVYSAKQVLDRLKELIEEKDRILTTTEISEKSFDTPNWAEKQAFKNGFRSCLIGLKNLIDLDQRIIKIDGFTR